MIWEEFRLLNIEDFGEFCKKLKFNEHLNSFETFPLIRVGIASRPLPLDITVSVLVSKFSLCTWRCSSVGIMWSFMRRIRPNGRWYATSTLWWNTALCCRYADTACVLSLMSHNYMAFICSICVAPCFVIYVCLFSYTREECWCNTAELCVKIIMHGFLFWVTFDSWVIWRDHVCLRF